MENLILEHLKAIRGKLGDIESQLRSLTDRVRSVELGLAALRRDTAMDAETIALVHSRMDQFHERLSRIERRLELTE